MCAGECMGVCECVCDEERMRESQGGRECKC